MKRLTNYKKLADMVNFETISRPVYVVSITEKVNKAGKTQAQVLVKDGYDINTVSIFDTSINDLTSRFPFFNEGSIVNMNITRKDPYFNADLRISEVDEEYDLSDIADKAIDNPEKYLSYIIKTVKSVSSAQEGHEYDLLSNLVDDIYDKYKTELMYSSSAISNHHTGIGGNLLHTSEVINICMCLLKSCLGKDIDAEILIAAAALHDVGKIFAYSTDKVGVATMTLGGCFMGGHHWDSLRIVEEESQKRKYNPEKLMILKNAIASHHGSREFGDIATPMSLEAFWLNMADNLSAKHYEAMKGIMELNPGEMSARGVYPLDTRLYRRTDQ